MPFLRKSTTIALLCFAIVGISQESESFLGPQDPLVETWEIKPFSYKKKFLFGSLSVVPGGGVSNRKRSDSKGTAHDVKIGAFFLVFDTIAWAPIITYDYNFLYYTRENEVSPYFSYGIGAAYIVPYVPLRAGIEFKNGFFDIGAKMILGVFPSPEIRGGGTIEF